MKNILLLNPPLYFEKGIPYALDSSVPPLGLLYIASYINKYSNKFKVKVIDIPVEKLSIKEIVKTVNRYKPLAVGISSMTPQLQGTVELATCLKKRCLVKPKLFLGGPHISADPTFINRFPVFDYAITVEVEKTFFDSINKLSQRKKIPTIQNGKIAENLDLLPSPDRKLIKRELYNKRESMMFSRGCPYRCYYCSRPAISKTIRSRSADNLVGEIKEIYSTCGGKIDFQDDTFTLNNKKVIDFCKAVEREKLKLDWRCNTRVDLVDKRLLKKMKLAGCSFIHFGIESGNEKIRKNVINKGSFSNKQIYQTLRLCKKYKIKTGGYFMIGHPGETKKEILETKKMIFKANFDLLGLSIPTPFPGSKLYEIAESKGIINKNIIDQFARKELGVGYSGIYPVFVPVNLSKNYLYGQMKEINRKFYLNLKTVFRRLKQDINSFEQLKKDAKDLFSLIIKGVSSRKPYKL